MKLEEFREICKQVDYSKISKFNQMFIDLILRAPEEKAVKLIDALPENVEVLRRLKRCQT